MPTRGYQVIPSQCFILVIVENKQRGTCTKMMGMWEFVYKILYQKKVLISTLIHQLSMHSQKFICLYIVLIHLKKILTFS